LAPKAPTAAAAAEKSNAGDLDRARDLANGGRLEEALAILDGVIKAAPACTEACFLMGVIREGAGDTAGAQKMFERALYLDGHHAEALLHLALIAGRKGDTGAEAGYRRRLLRIRDDRSTR
jgi:chemotaxis protein methyltransferase WspC